MVAYFTLLKAYWLVRKYPLEKLVSKIKKTIKVVPMEQKHIKIQTIKKAISIAAQYTPWRSACYEQAVAAILLLRIEGIDASLFIGTKAGDDGFAFHAWTTANESCVTGGDNAPNEYKTLSRF